MLKKLGERVEPKFFEILRRCKTFFEAWNELKKFGESMDIASVMKLRDTFNNIKLDHGTDILEFLTTSKRDQRILKGTEAPISDTVRIMKIMSSLSKSWDPFIQEVRANRESLSSCEVSN